MEHWIFGATIEHTIDGKSETIDSLFENYIDSVTKRIIEMRPDFVLSSEFIKLNDELAIWLSTQPDNKLKTVATVSQTIEFKKNSTKNPLIHSASVGVLPIKEVDQQSSKKHDISSEQLKSGWTRKTRKDYQKFRLDDPFAEALKTILSDVAITKPKRATVTTIDSSDQLISMSLSLLPEWGKTDPYAMGIACVDECYRQLIASGSNPDRIAIQDNFYAGNPEDPETLGAIVEAVKGIATVAETYNTPFISSNQSFNHELETSNGPKPIPVTSLISGIGVIEDNNHVTPASLQSSDSVIAIIGTTCNALGGSILAHKVGLTDAWVPSTDLYRNLALYKSLYDVIKSGWIRSTHNISQGGLAVTLADMGSKSNFGLDISLDQLPLEKDATETSMLFSESPGRLVLEIDPKDFNMVEALFGGQPFAKIGQTTDSHTNLNIELSDQTLISEPAAELVG